MFHFHTVHSNPLRDVTESTKATMCGGDVHIGKTAQMAAFRINWDFQIKPN